MRHVLLADDARLLSEFGGTAAGRSDFRLTRIAADDDIAARARELRPDVVVLEEGESCPDALEACRRIRSDPATAAIPVIYVGLAFDPQRARRAGASVVVPRPFTRRDLREALARVLAVPDRVAVRRPVDLDVVIESDDRVVPARCRDLSLSGAFLEPVDRRVDLPVGRRGLLTMRAGERRLRLEVEIVRRGRGCGAGEGVGVRFVDVDAPTSAFLARFVRRAGDRRARAGGGSP